MSQQISAAFEEFWDLKNLLEGKAIQEINFSPIRRQAGDDTPERKYFGTLRADHPQCIKSIFEWERFFLMDQDGRKVVEVGMVSIRKSWYRPSTWRGEVRICETISQALMRSSRAVHAVVKFDPILNRLTILKSPVKFTVQEWLEKID